MKEKISGFGSMISALLASICCIAPYIIIALGVSGAGWLPFLDRLRPLFILIAICCLAWAWWIVIKKEKEKQKALKNDRIFLSVITLIVLLLIFLPKII